jgi:hypothetical protein
MKLFCLAPIVRTNISTAERNFSSRNIHEGHKVVFYMETAYRAVRVPTECIETCVLKLARK